MGGRYRRENLRRDAAQESSMSGDDDRVLHVIGTSASGPHDPSFRIRVALPGRALAAHGITIEELPLFSAEQTRKFRRARPIVKATIIAQARRRLRQELRAEAREGSTVLIQRRVDLAPSLALERVATRDRRLIYDVDDAVWLSGRQTGGHYLSFLKAAARKTRWLANRAEHIVAGSEILAEHLAPHNDAITVVPSLVDPATYAIRHHEQKSVLTLGWIGSPTTARYLSQIGPILDRFAQQSTRPVRLLIVGGEAPHLNNVEVQERTWSPESERMALAEIDIGLMPLEDTPWSRGKCAYKALLYMVCGIPPLVSDVGVSAAVVADAGCVATDDAHWLEGLHALADDASLRARLGAVGRRRTEQDFSFARWLPISVQILKGS
jgi:glycosyltransferase involved in cell wall biosynthesis